MLVGPMSSSLSPLATAQIWQQVPRLPFGDATLELCCFPAFVAALTAILVRIVIAARNVKFPSVTACNFNTCPLRLGCFHGRRRFASFSPGCFRECVPQHFFNRGVLVLTK